ncbi:MAG: PilZ domain-containing protein [Pseudohaliea sp.]
MSSERERREYYRIDDVLPLWHTPVPEPGGGAADAGPQDPLAQLDSELNDAINHVFQADPAAGQALGLLNRKLDLLAALLPGRAGDGERRHVPTAVNVSGSGIAFDSCEPLPVGARRRLGLLLQPSQVAVELDGTVQESEASDNPAMPYRIRVAFDDDEFSQEQIIRYVVQRQAMRRAEEVAAEGGDSPPDS